MHPIELESKQTKGSGSSSVKEQWSGGGADALAGGDMEGLSEPGDGRERALKGRVNKQTEPSRSDLGKQR